MSAPTLLSMPPSSFQPPPPLWSPPFIPPPPDLPPLPHQPPPSAPLPANFVCLDTCTSPNQNDASLKSLEHINNGVCEDGGPDVRANATQRNTSQTVCAFGTDCLDCGVRKLPDPYPWATTIVLVFIFVGLPLIFLWYRRKCDRNRDVCVFPTCVCRFFAVHLWRMQLSRAYTADQMANQRTMNETGQTVGIQKSKCDEGGTPKVNTSSMSTRV
mmetsp:Transcript_12231/g.37490  ORF Transcript_12231/g.37490 Transcript_12231/m.37490 type:complete len:214 (-) Transcript_12231:182-823(-)